MTTTRLVSNGITVSAAASLLSLSPKTVYAACADGRISAVKVAGHWSVDAVAVSAPLLAPMPPALPVAPLFLWALALPPKLFAASVRCNVALARYRLKTLLVP